MDCDVDESRGGGLTLIYMYWRARAYTEIHRFIHV